MSAGKRQKVRWVLNPRNTEWSSDGNKYGQRLLEQMGWKAGCGLGANLQGATDHVKVSVRSDNRGVGFKDRPENVLPHQSKFAELLAQLAVNEQPSEHVQDKKFSLESESRQSRARVNPYKLSRSKDVSKYSQKDLSCILGIPEKAYESVDVNADKGFIRSHTLFVKDVIDQEENLYTQLHSPTKKQKFETGGEYITNTVSSGQLKMVNENGLEMQESSLTCIEATQNSKKNWNRFEESGEQQNSTNSSGFELEESTFISCETSKKRQKKTQGSRLTDNQSSSNEILKEMSEDGCEENSSTPTEKWKKKRRRPKEGSEECSRELDLRKEKDFENSSTSFSKWENLKVRESKDNCFPDTGCFDQQKVTHENDVLPEVDSLMKKENKKKKKQKKCEENEGSRKVTSSDENGSVVESSVDLQDEKLVIESVDVQAKKKKKKDKHLVDENGLVVESVDLQDKKLDNESVDVQPKKKKKKDKHLVGENVPVVESVDLQDEKLDTESVDVQPKKKRKKDKDLVGENVPVVESVDLQHEKLDTESVDVQSKKKRKMDKHLVGENVPVVESVDLQGEKLDTESVDVQPKKKRKKDKDLVSENVPVVESVDLQDKKLDTESVDVQPKKKRKKNKHLVEEDDSTIEDFSKSMIDSTSLMDTTLTVENIKDMKKKRKTIDLVDDVYDAKHDDSPTNLENRKQCTKYNKSEQESKVCDTSTTDCSKQAKTGKKSVRFSENCKVLFIQSVKKANESSYNCPSVDQNNPSLIKSDVCDTKTQAENPVIKDKKEYNFIRGQNHSTEQKIFSSVGGRVQEEFPADCVATKSVAKNHKIILNGIKYVNGIATNLNRVPRRSRYDPAAAKSIPYWERRGIVVDFPGSNIETMGYGVVNRR